MTITQSITVLITRSPVQWRGQLVMHHKVTAIHEQTFEILTLFSTLTAIAHGTSSNKPFNIFTHSGPVYNITSSFLG